MNKFTFFWQIASPFSNWHKSSFVHNGVTYSCAEQYMMHMKALAFDDVEVAALIMETNEPRHHKMLGREVRNFDASTWSAICKEVMVDGLVSKFLQNPNCLEALLASGETILVEASPYDKIWGIGMLESDPNATDQTKWLGQNLLGFVLMEVRDVIRRRV